MGTIFQELQRILGLMKTQGVSRVWISQENLNALYQLPQRPAAPMPTAQPRPQPPQQAPAQQPPRPPMQQPQQQPYATQSQPPRMQQPYAPRYAAQPPPGVMSVRAPMPPQANVPVEPMPDVSAMDWDALQNAAFNCHACRLHASRHSVVFDDGCRKARVMFIGEGPGEDEDRQGKPFVGRAGQLLTKMILAMGLDRNSPDPATAAYIANIVKCRPPQNRNPLPEEGGVCVGYVKRQIELVQPEAIILLGSVPLSFLMGKTGIMRLRGQWLQYNGIPVMPTFHPSYLLRCESRGPQAVAEEKRKVWLDLQQVMARLGLKRPQRP